MNTLEKNQLGAYRKTKWISRDTATERVMMQQKQSLFSSCPMCDSKDKYTRHVLSCTNSKVVKLRSNLIEELNTWISTVNTHPDIQLYITSSIYT